MAAASHDDLKKPPLLVRALIDDKRTALKVGLRSHETFTLRRFRVLLANAQGAWPAAIAPRFGCASQSVRNAIRALKAEGLACLRPRSHRPGTARPELDEAACQRLRPLLHRSPRDLGKPTSLWTLALAAEVALAEEISVRLLNDEWSRMDRPAIHALGRE